MFQGMVEQRRSPRAPFSNEIIIHFKDENSNSIIANAIDISAGGIQFSIPLVKNYFNDGERVKLLFDIPFYGKTSIEAEIKHLRFSVGLDNSRIVLYGAKFSNITMDIWNAIMDYSQEKIEQEDRKKEPYSRKDIRVKVGLAAKLYLETGQYFFCHIEDISFGGAKLQLNASIPVNEPVKLLLIDTHSFEVEGECVWSEPSGVANDLFYTGVFFNQLDTIKFYQLRSFIFKLADRKISI